MRSARKSPRTGVLAVRPQVLVEDVRAEAAQAGLDVGRFIEQIVPLLPYVPDVPDDDDSRFVRCLLEPRAVGEGVRLRHTLDLYGNVDRRWKSIITRLRVRDVADCFTLAHEEALGTARFVEAGDEFNEVEQDDGVTVLCPCARTFGVHIPLDAVGFDDCRLAPPEPVPSSEVDELAEVLAERLEKHMGGAAFLAPSRHERALSVLAATVATILAHGSSVRRRGTYEVVRPDSYRAIFGGLGLENYFMAGRVILETGNKNSVAITAPWPPGVGVRRSLAILKYEDGALVLEDWARLRLLPVGIGYVTEDDEG